MEAVLHINKLWRINKYFTFSSFRSGVMAMYHRIFFNLLLLLLAVIEVWFTRKYDNQTKILTQTGVLVLFTCYAFVARPYRSNWANIVLLVGLSGVSMQYILIQCIVSGYQ